MIIETIRRLHCDPLTETDIIQTLTDNEKYIIISETATSVVFEKIDRYHSSSAKTEEVNDSE